MPISEPMDTWALAAIAEIQSPTGTNVKKIISTTMTTTAIINEAISEEPTTMGDAPFKSGEGL
jgi:hypothetical protein